MCLCEWIESAREHMSTDDKTRRITLIIGDFGYNGSFEFLYLQLLCKSENVSKPNI